MRYLIQLHLTERCNLRCKHCYQESSSKSPIMTVEQAREVMEQAKELATLNGFDSLKVNLTGGEPLLLPNIRDYIDVVLEYADLLLLMTNGTLIDEGMAKYLAERGVYVQVSLDGTKTTHDLIRGAGSYDRATAGIRALVANGVYVMVGCTIHKDNYLEVEEVVREAKANGASKVWFDRYVPCGNAQPLSTTEFVEAMTLLAGACRHETKSFKVGTSRELQFLFSGTMPTCCGALTRAMTVMPDGTVYPCRRMPIRLGNCSEERLVKFYDSPLRRMFDEPPKGCAGCSYEEMCRGGARCLTYAMSGGFDGADPNCFLIKEEG